MKYNHSMPKGAKTVTFQITLEGWTAEHGDQAHLVKWVNAPSKKALERFIEKYQLHIDEHGVDIVPHLTPKDHQNDAEYEPHPVQQGSADVLIDNEGNIVEGDLGKTTPTIRKPYQTQKKKKKTKKSREG